MKEFKADLKLKDPSCKPVFKKARPTPFAFREALDRELEQLETEVVLEKVTRRDWATQEYISSWPSANS